jgi:hypothetical protein
LAILKKLITKKNIMDNSTQKLNDRPLTMTEYFRPVASLSDEGFSIEPQIKAAADKWAVETGNHNDGISFERGAMFVQQLLQQSDVSGSVLSNEIIEGNKFIAEFMGYKFNAYPDLKHYNVTKPNENEWCFAAWDVEDFENYIKEKMNYDSCWNLIMPVIEKISRIKIKWKNSSDIDTYYPRTFGMLQEHSILR